MRRIAQFILRHSVLVSVLGTVLGLVGAYYSVLLYKNLRTDIEELLPTTARSIVDLNEITRRLEAIDNIVVVTLSQDTRASKRFMNDLASRLSLAPKSVVSTIEYRIDRELKFFSERKALLMELGDLEKVRDYTRDRIAYEKELYNPLNIFSERQLQEPSLDFLALRKKYDSQASTFAKFPEGYYATPDEKVRVLIAYMPGKGIEAAHKLRAEIDRAITTLNPKRYAPDLEIRFTGNIQNLIEENAALIADLIESTVIVMVLVTAAMMVFFRSMLTTLILVWSLFMGTFWTFGVAYFAVGYLNANSAFLASIVIGNGINFGTIFLARYLEERRYRKPHEEAAVIAISRTATSTWTAALAAGLSYGSLVLTEFRGFKQFGVIGLIGMVLCWLSAYLLLPAYLTLLDRARKGRLVAARPVKPLLAGWIASAVDRFPKLVSLISIGFLLASFAAFTNAREGVIEMDLNKLRDKDCMEKGSGFNSQYIDAVFGRGLSPMVILPRNRDDAERIAAAFKKQKKLEGPETLFTTVQGIDDFVPRDQDRKIEVLKEVRNLLPPHISAQLSEDDRKLAREFLTPQSFKTFREADLPPMILSRFRERDGTVGKMVLVDKVMGHGTDRLDVQIPFVKKVREITDAIAPGTPIAGQLPVSTDMLEAVVRDGPRATLFAFLAIVVLVILLFRNLATVVQALLALLLGITWLAGLMLGFGLKINFLNFIALPITFGIGIDYGVNIFQRLREEGPENLISVIRNTGGAVMLCSLTTIIGYGSLLIAGNQAFVSFGRLAVLGELTTVTAAVVTLPAVLRTLAGWRRKPAERERPAIETAAL